MARYAQGMLGTESQSRKLKDGCPEIYELLMVMGVWNELYDKWKGNCWRPAYRKLLETGAVRMAHRPTHIISVGLLIPQGSGR